MFCASLLCECLRGATVQYLTFTHAFLFSILKIGAISWAIVNVLIGPTADHFGFASFYPLVMLVTVVYFLSIAAFVHGQEETTEETQHPSSNDHVSAMDDSITKDHDTPQVTKVPIWTLLCILAGTFYGASFLIAVVLLSSGMSVVESLVFLFFEFLGGSNTMCGITVALTVMFEIPIFHVAPKLLRRFGSGSLLLIAGVSYMVRVIGYSIIPKGHVALVLLLEPLHGVTYACAQTSTVDFAQHLMPKGSEASGQGLMGVFKGIGSVTGLFLGGVLEETLGPRIMYRIFATTVAVGMCVLSFASWRQPMASRQTHDVLPQSETELSSSATSSGKDEIDREDTITTTVNQAVVEFI